MKTEKIMVALEILKAIKNTPRITAKEISEETGITTQYVRNILRVLAELKLVETPARGIYIITSKGEKNLIKKKEGDE